MYLNLIEKQSEKTTHEINKSTTLEVLNQSKRRFFWLFMYLLLFCFSFHNMQAQTLEPKVYDSSLIKNDWPELHKAIAKKDFTGAQSILLSNPNEAQKRAFAEYSYDELNALGWYFEMQKIYKRSTEEKSIPMTYTSLELAILYDAPVEFIGLLIQSGADVSAKRMAVITSRWGGPGYNFEARTPLLAAINKQNLDIITLLMNSGADIDHVIWKGGAHYEVGDFGDGHWTPINGGWRSFDTAWKEFTKSL